MKIFLIIYLVSGLASSVKLDRSYLPPPGSKYSGGSPGDIDVPLEYPKQSPGQQDLVNGKPEIELGINRRPGLTGTPDSQKPGFTYFQNSYPVPTTTTTYAITQTTTFPDYDGIDEPNAFVNGSNAQPGARGQNNQQPIRGPGQGLNYNQYQPGSSQPTVAPYGTTTRPPFPSSFNGLDYLPPVNNKQSSGQVSNQYGTGYPSDLGQGPKYQGGHAIAVNQPDSVSPGFNQQNHFIGSQNVPSTLAPQYQDERFGATGSSSQQKQEQFQGNHFPSSTAAPQYQAGQKFTTSGSNEQNLFLGNQQLPSSTAAPQYQGGERLTIPELNQQNRFTPSTTGTQNQPKQGDNGIRQYDFPFGAPTQFPSSTATPTPGPIQQNQYSEGLNYPTTSAPHYQEGQRFTTPGQISAAPQFQDGGRYTTPGYVQEGYGSPVSTQQSQNQYSVSQNFPSSTSVPQYQTDQPFATGGPAAHNFPSTVASYYQNGQRFTKPVQYQGQSVPGQQFGRPGQQSQSNVGYDYSSSSTAAPQYQDSQRFSTPGSQQRFGASQQNFPTSTTAPQFQDQRYSTPGQLFNQPTYPGSTVAPQYQQIFAPTPGVKQPGAPKQQNQFQQPTYNQQIPSSTAAPQRFIPGSQSKFDTNIIPTPDMEVFAQQQGLPEGQTYGNNQQPESQTEAGSSIYGTAPSFSDNRFPSTTAGSLPVRDFASTPGFGGRRPERPQAEGDRNAEILSYENVLTPEGYFYSYDTSNGIHADETGVVDNGTRAQGGFTYTGDDGKIYSVVYTADENGFQPRGDHLPTPPPIPEAIQRVIDQANMEKEAGIHDDGSYNEEKYGYMNYEGPLTHSRPKNKTVSLLNGVNILENNKYTMSKPNRKVFRPKASPPGSKPGSTDEFKPDETDTNDSSFEEIGMDDGNDDNFNDNEEVNRRISNNRPNPIKDIIVEDNRPDQLKGTIMTLNVNSKKNGSSHRPILINEYEENASDEEPEDNEDGQDSDSFDFDSDLINYRDDPNNRTDFHGLNKYLPESKKTHRKNMASKNGPMMRVDGAKRPLTGVIEAETAEEHYKDKSQGTETKPHLVDESHTRIPSRKNKFRQKIKNQSTIPGQTVRLDSDDETNTYDDNKFDAGVEYDTDDTTKPVTNIRKNKPTKSQTNNKLGGKPNRLVVNQETAVSNNKENEPSLYDENGYQYTPPQRKFGSEESISFPSRTNQKGIQTTVRPFLTKNVYGDENEPTDEYIDQYENVKPVQPGQPMTTQKNSGFNQASNKYNQNNPGVNGEVGFSTTRRPVTFGTSRKPFGRPQTTATPQYQQGVTDQDGENYNQNTPEINHNQGFSTTRKPVYSTSQRPFGRQQTSVAPQYQDQKVTGQFNKPISNQGNRHVGFSTTRRPASFGTSRPPFGRPQTSASPQYQQGMTDQDGENYNQNTPEINQNQGFSTTRKPVYGTSQRPFGRPQTSAPQYQDQEVTGQFNTPISNQGSQRPEDKLFYNTNAPNRGTIGNVFSSTTPLPPSGPDSASYQRPGQYQNIPEGSYYEATSPKGETYMNSNSNRPGYVPSTTYRPNYSFGDKINVDVDGSGRPIQSTTAPAFDPTGKPVYSSRPNEEPNNQQKDRFRPTAGRFGVTSGPEVTPGYQTSAPIGEDFSGPKQPQRYDPKTGYHYK